MSPPSVGGLPSSRIGDRRATGRWGGLETRQQARASTPAAAGELRPARSGLGRIQPLLLAAGVATVLPAAVEAGASTPAVVSLVAFGTMSVASWPALRRDELPLEIRRLIGIGLAVISVASLLVLLFGIEGQRPETYLLLTSALVCSLASIPSLALRWSLQIASVVAVGAALAWADRAALDVGMAVFLVLVVALLANLLAGELLSARRSEVAARAQAERRTELLEAVRDLPRTGADAAVTATVRTLRSLAFDEARVVVVRDGQLREVDSSGEVADVVPRSRSLEWQVVEEDLTLVASASAGGAGPDLSGYGDVSSVVAAPIRVAGHPAGVLVGGRRNPGEPSPAEVEVAEVLAAHLGVVLDTEAQVRRQRELLERMADLDQMRSGFAREVSIELRDPLTIVRTVGEAMTRHGDTIDPQRRRALLEQMCDHAEDLRRTIDALLDFSRFQAGREDAEPVSIPLVDLLRPVLRAAGAESEPPLSELRDLGVVVEADVVRVRHALEILLVAGLTEVSEEPVATLRIQCRRDTEVRLEVHRRDGTVPSTLVRSLVSQLLVAGGGSLDEGASPVVLLRGVGAAVEVTL